jgi:hypothetical protein
LTLIPNEFMCGVACSVPGLIADSVITRVTVVILCLGLHWQRQRADAQERYGQAFNVEFWT